MKAIDPVDFAVGWAEASAPGGQARSSQRVGRAERSTGPLRNEREQAPGAEQRNDVKANPQNPRFDSACAVKAKFTALAQLQG